MVRRTLAFSAPCIIYLITFSLNANAEEINVFSGYYVLKANGASQSGDIFPAPGKCTFCQPFTNGSAEASVAFPYNPNYGYPSGGHEDEDPPDGAIYASGTNFSLTDNPNGTVTGSTTVLFTPVGGNVYYSVHDEQPVFTSVASANDLNYSASYDVILEDTSGGPPTYLDADGVVQGSSSGYLFAGQTYSFEVDAEVLNETRFSPSTELANVTYDASLDIYPIVSGSEPSNTAVTPEPPSLALLGTGVLAVIGAVRRRFNA
jgi:hypothetical protein